MGTPICLYATGMIVCGSEIKVRAHKPLHNIFPRAACALHKPISVGTASKLASKMPKESAKPIEPILNSRSCRERSLLSR